MKKLKFSLLLTMAITLSTTLLPSQKVSAEENPPRIVGTAGITMDLSTGEIIYANRADDKVYPASITKLMTALLFAENKTKNDLISYTEEASKQPQYSLKVDYFRNIQIGDTLTGEDTMEALLLFSANDTAYMIADSVGGNTENFIKMMNDKAKELHMNNTNYVTANGLHHEDHYTTAYDLALLGQAAYNNSWVREVMVMTDSRITLSTGEWTPIENRNKLLGKDGGIGGKTGYTSAAGRCLVALYERDGRPMVGVVMRSAYDAEDTQVFKDMETIINWSYNVEPTVVTPADTVVETEVIQYKPLRFFGPTKEIEVPIIIKEDISYYQNHVNESDTKTEININNINIWKLSEDSEVGKLDLNQRDYSKSYILYTNITKSDIVSQNKVLYIISGLAVFSTVSLVLFLILLISRGTKRRRRRSRNMF